MPYVKTDKTYIHEKRSYVVYKDGNTRFIRLNRKFTSVTSLLQSKKNKKVVPGGGFGFYEKTKRTTIDHRIWLNYYEKIIKESEDSLYIRVYGYYAFGYPVYTGIRTKIDSTQKFFIEYYKLPNEQIAKLKGADMNKYKDDLDYQTFVNQNLEKLRSLSFDRYINTPRTADGGKGRGRGRGTTRRGDGKAKAEGGRLLGMDGPYEDTKTRAQRNKQRMEELEKILQDINEYVPIFEECLKSISQFIDEWYPPVLSEQHEVVEGGESAWRKWLPYEGTRQQTLDNETKKVHIINETNKLIPIVKKIEDEINQIQTTLRKRNDIPKHIKGKYFSHEKSENDFTYTLKELRDQLLLDDQLKRLDYDQSSPISLLPFVQHLLKNLSKDLKQIIDKKIQPNNDFKNRFNNMVRTSPVFQNSGFDFDKFASPVGDYQYSDDGYYSGDYYASLLENKIINNALKEEYKIWYGKQKWRIPKNFLYKEYLYDKKIGEETNEEKKEIRKKEFIDNLLRELNDIVYTSINDTRNYEFSTVKNILTERIQKIQEAKKKAKIANEKEEERIAKQEREIAEIIAKQKIAEANKKGLVMNITSSGEEAKKAIHHWKHPIWGPYHRG